MPLSYIFPAEQKEFWGTESMNHNGSIVASVAYERIKTYTKTQKLLGEQEFRLDETLKKLLLTTRDFMLLSELPKYLTPYMTPLNSDVKRFCPSSSNRVWVDCP